ncbi:putative glutathione S-transferase [Silene latifolia]|uniref:putative glutathione S-transferase n=1 Tax=Silene latifolia TaxID=37657 RepID=UPI003D778D33
MEHLKLLGTRGSPVNARVEIALQLKGVDYEFAQQDLQNKSDELLKYNPIHKKIPVLLHNGLPIVESLLILEYIDEIWKENALLPVDPYCRAQARFWAKFIDEMIMPATVNAFLGEGDTEKATEELQEHLKTFEKGMKTAELFKENKIKYLDIAGLFVIYWIPVLQEFAGKNVLTRDNFPEIMSWADDIFSCDVVQKNLPDKQMMFGFLRLSFPHVNPNAHRQ